MAITTYDFESGTDGANVGTGGGITAVSGSPPTYSNGAAFTASGMGISSVGQQWAEWDAPAADFSFSWYGKVTTNPGTSSQRVINLRTPAAAIAGSIRFHSSGAIAIVNASNVVVGASATTTWTTSDQFRLDVKVDDSGADVIVTMRIYKNSNIGGTTPDEEISRTLTGVDVSSLRVGGNDAGAWTVLWDNLSLSNVLEWIGPYNPPLAPLPTPVVTVTEQNNPTTAGGTNGSIKVTWPPVSGDVDHYAAGIAVGHNMTSGFTIVSSAATSPFTFTGLAAGNYTVAIRAVPA